MTVDPLRALGESIEQCLSRLFAMEVLVDQTLPHAYLHGKVAAVISYVDDEGRPAVIITCDLPLIAIAGAAMTRIPVPFTDERLSSGDLTEEMRDGFHEVMNVLNSVFPKAGMPCLHLSGVLMTPTTVPPQTTRAMAAVEQRMDYEITIGAYGAGRITVLLLPPGHVAPRALALTAATPRVIGSLVSRLIDRTVVAIEREARLFHDGDRCVIGVYVRDDGSPSVGCICSPELAWRIGTALVRCAVGAPAEARISSGHGELAGDILDGFREVLNVIAQAFNPPGEVYQRLNTVEVMAMPLPATLAAMLRLPRSRLDVDLVIDGGGAGTMTFFEG